MNFKYLLSITVLVCLYTATNNAMTDEYQGYDQLGNATSKQEDLADYFSWIISSAEEIKHGTALNDHILRILSETDLKLLKALTQESDEEARAMISTAPSSFSPECLDLTFYLAVDKWLQGKWTQTFICQLMAAYPNLTIEIAQPLMQRYNGQEDDQDL